VITLTDQGLAALKQRMRVALTKPLVAPPTARPRAGEIECDEALFERLRQLRKKLADELTVPSYIVFSDVSLRHMARTCPTDRTAFAQIPGVGERKLKDFGEAFLAEIKKFLADRPAPEPGRRPPDNTGAGR
jgi:ATP-dependent DNA helicase RecQ